MVAAPTFLRQGDAFCYSFPEIGELGTMIVLDQLREGRESLDAEVTVQTFLGVNGTDKPGRIDWFSLNLKAAQTRERAAKSLAAATQQPEAQWSEMLKYAVMRTVEEHRRGEPVVDLATTEVSLDLEYLIYPTVIRGETNMVIADGKAGKSLYALLTAYAAARKIDLPGGIRPQKRIKTLYLDWEASRGAHARRLEWICRGFGHNRADLAGWLHYRRMWAPLSAEVARTKRDIHTLGTELVVIDSIGGAADDELKNTTAARLLFNAARSLESTILMVHHITKAEAASGGPSTPLGSTYFKNYARSVDEIRSTKVGKSELGLSIWNRWSNDGEPRDLPIGWRLRFDQIAHQVLVSSLDVAETPALMASGGQEYMIRAALRRSAMTAAEIGEETNIKAKVVDMVLRRMSGITQTVKGKPGPKGNPAVWGLKCQEEE